MSQDVILWIVIVAVIAMTGLIAWRIYYSRPHDFPSFHDDVHTWHPGDRFTDSDGNEVTEPRTIANLMKAWRSHNRGF